MSAALREHTHTLIARADALLDAHKPRQRVFPAMEHEDRILSREEAGKAFAALKMSLLEHEPKTQ